MNSATNIQIRTADSATSDRREHRFADGILGGMIEMAVHRSIGGVTFQITWNVHNGRGWAKGWKKAGLRTEQEALDFAAGKWLVLVVWLEKLEPVTHNGAAAAFSAQVATIH